MKLRSSFPLSATRHRSRRSRRRSLRRTPHAEIGESGWPSGSIKSTHGPPALVLVELGHFDIGHGDPGEGFRSRPVGAVGKDEHNVRLLAFMTCPLILAALFTCALPFGCDLSPPGLIRKKVTRHHLLKGFT